MVDINKDLSTLTTISESVFNKLDDKIVWCISDAVEKAILNGDETIEINLGFGTLFINISNNEIKYKFKPDSKLEKAVMNTVVDGKNELELIFEQTLVTKMTNTYKDLL